MAEENAVKDENEVSEDNESQMPRNDPFNPPRPGVEGPYSEPFYGGTTAGNWDGDPPLANRQVTDLSRLSPNQRQQVIEALINGYDKASAKGDKLSYSTLAAQVYSAAAADTFDIDQAAFRQFKQLEEVALNAGFLAQLAHVPATVKEMVVEHYGTHTKHPLQTLPFAQIAMELTVKPFDLQGDVKGVAQALKGLAATPAQVWNHERGLYTDSEREALATIYRAENPDDRLEAVQRFRAGDVAAALNFAMAASALAKVKLPNLPLGGGRQAITAEGMAITLPESMATTSASAGAVLPPAIGGMAIFPHGEVNNKDTTIPSEALQRAHQDLKDYFENIPEEHKATMLSVNIDLQTTTKQVLIEKKLREKVAEVTASAFPEGIQNANLDEVVAFTNEAKNRMMKLKGLVAEEAEITSFTTPDLNNPIHHDLWRTVVAKNPNGTVDVWVAANELNPDLKTSFYQKLEPAEILNNQGFIANIKDIEGFKQAAGISPLLHGGESTLGLAAFRAQQSIKSELLATITPLESPQPEGLESFANRAIKRHMGDMGVADSPTYERFKIVPAGAKDEYIQVRSYLNRIGYDIYLASYNDVFSIGNLTAKFNEELAQLDNPLRATSIVAPKTSLVEPGVTSARDIYYPSGDANNQQFLSSDGFEP